MSLAILISAKTKLNAPLYSENLLAAVSEGSFPTPA